jgi:ketosteroid isomerase-like protein
MAAPLSPLSPREVAEQVRRMVAGEGVTFADLFAPDGVLAYPFAPPGAPAELTGREAIRAYFAGLGQARELLDMEGVEAVVRETDDPEVVVTEITHHGWSRAADAPYRFTALGIIRVRGGQIVRYEDYMDPIAMARILGRTADLAAALSGG